MLCCLCKVFDCVGLCSVAHLKFLVMLVILVAMNATDGQMFVVEKFQGQ